MNRPAWIRRGLAITAGLLAMTWLGVRIIAWAAPALCDDGRIEPFTQFQLGVNMVVLAVLAMAAWRQRAWRVPVLARIPRTGWIATACGIIPAGLYLGSCRVPSWRPWFAENGWLETTTPVLALAAAFLFFRSALTRREVPGQTGREALLYALLASGAFVLAMEEVSWGQAIVGWKAPETLFRYNVQGETNLHNFFNAGFPFLYETAGWILGGAAAASASRARQKHPRSGWAVILPPVPLTGLVMLAFLFRFWHEVFEEQVGWLLFFHAWLDAFDRKPEGR